MSMRLIKLSPCIIVFAIWPPSANGQDPSFSQFFAVPTAVNPATAGAFDGDVRIMANLRQQWLDPAAPYHTGSLSYETKIAQTRTNVKEYRDDNILAIRAGFLHDNSFKGILKGSYAHLQLAYHQVLDADGENRLGVGFGASFGRQYIDQSRLYFASQFTSGGFVSFSPTASGEFLLGSMRNSLSLSAGLNYSFSSSSGKVSLEAGAAGFHLNEPRQTFLKDPNQIIPRRLTGHFSIDFASGVGNSISMLSAYHHQAGIGTLLAGVGFNKNLFGGTSTYASKFITAGALYRLRDAIIPYVSLFTNGIRVGFSYDVTVSKLLLTPGKPKTFELSFSWRIARNDFERRCPRVFSGFR